MVGILYERKFVPIAIGVFSHETVDVFQMVFEWIDNNATVSPTNLMADGDEGTRSAALTVWPSVVLLMCSWHQKKASEKHMKEIKKNDLDIWEQLRFDITTLQLFAVDEDSFNVAYKLLERKYVEEIECDKELETILREFFRYFSDEWIICSRKKGWYQAANPLGPSTNNSLERMNRTFKVTTNYEHFLMTYVTFLLFLRFSSFLAQTVTFLAQIITILAQILTILTQIVTFLAQNLLFITFQDNYSMRRRLSIENHFVKISTMMKDYGLPEKIDEEEISLERMVEAEKFINQNEHYISYKDVATGHKFFIKKDYGVKRGSVTKVFVMPYRATPDIDAYSFLKKSGIIIICS